MNVYGTVPSIAEAVNVIVWPRNGVSGVKTKFVDRTGGPVVTGIVFKRHPQPSGLLAQFIAP